MEIKKRTLYLFIGLVLFAGIITASEFGYDNSQNNFGINDAPTLSMSDSSGEGHPTDVMTTLGDLLYMGTGPTLARLPIGSSNRALLSSGSIPYWSETPFYVDKTTTAGDLLYRNPSGTLARLPMGSIGQVLTSFGGSTIAWDDSPTNVLTTTGDIMFRDQAGNLNRLPIGTSGQVLESNGTIPSWATASGGGGFTTDQNDELNTTGSPTFDNLNITDSIGVGIGGTPSYALDVQSSAFQQARFTRTTSTGTGFELANTGGHSIIFGLLAVPNSGFFVSDGSAYYYRADQNDIMMRSDMSLSWSSTDTGGSSWSRDTRLFRDSAGVLRTVGDFIVDDNLGIGTTTPSYPLHLDTLSTGAFTEMARFEGDTGYIRLVDDDRSGFQRQILNINNNVLNNNSNHIVFGTGVDGESYSRGGFNNEFELVWGTGSSSYDTNLYRVSANKLKTDDSLEVVGTLDVGNKGGFSQEVEMKGAGANGYLSFTGTAGGGGEGITYKGSAGTDRYSLFFPGSNEVALGSRGSNGFVSIRANTGTAGGGGEVTVADFEDNKVTIYEETILSSLANTYTGGSAYVCVYNNGSLFASESACP